MVGINLFSLFADFIVDALSVALPSNESTAAIASFRCLPKRNICPMPRKIPGFLARLCLPSFNELWNGPWRLMKPSSLSAVFEFPSRSQCFRDAKSEIFGINFIKGIQCLRKMVKQHTSFNFGTNKLISATPTWCSQS